MSTGIQWTDETWNAITGCKQVSPGCANCYAKVEHDRRHKAHRAGKQVAPQYAEPFEVVQLHPDRLDAPLRRRKPTRYFVTSGADPFHEDVPDGFIDKMFAVMAMAPRHTFQLLTKRPLRMRDYLLDEGLLDRIHDAIRAIRQQVGSRLGHNDHVAGRWPMRHVWLGTSVENQRWANERIQLLRQTPAAVIFLSCEPLLGSLELGLDDEGRAIDWVIVGGESGREARPCDVHALTDVVAQCGLSGVPCFVKQIGSRPVTPDLTHWRCPATLLPDSSGYALKLRDSHGGDMAEWPEELRVREFPSGEVRAPDVIMESPPCETYRRGLNPQPTKRRGGAR